MGGFRDDREALRARIEALEAELRSGGPDRSEVLERLEELTGHVARARERLDADRHQLGDLAGRIEALRRDLRGESDGPWPDIEDGRAQAASERDAQRMRSRLGIGCVALLLCGMCGLWALDRRTPKYESVAVADPTLLISASALPGGEHSVQPTSVLEHVHGYVPSGAQLSSMEMRYVSSDGTLDLDHPSYHATMELRFEQSLEPERGSEAVPLGAPRPPPAVRSTTYRVDGRGLHRDLAAGMALPSRGVVGDPSCEPARVWDAAIAAGAPPNAVAHLRYGRAGFGSRNPDAAVWTFEIDHTDISLRIADATCEVVGLPRAVQLDAGASDELDAGSSDESR